MVNGIRTIYFRGLNNGFGSKFYAGSQVWLETPEEVQKTYWSKRCEYNNEDEDNCPITLSGKKTLQELTCG